MVPDSNGFEFRFKENTNYISFKPLIAKLFELNGLNTSEGSARFLLINAVEIDFEGQKTKVFPMIKIKK